jgi:hypothetical protein
MVCGPETRRPVRLAQGVDTLLPWFHVVAGPNARFSISMLAKEMPLLSEPAG